MKRAFGPSPSFFQVANSRRKRNHLSAIFLTQFCFLGAVKSKGLFILHPLKSACTNASRRNTKANRVDVENLLPGSFTELIVAREGAHYFYSVSKDIT